MTHAQHWATRIHNEAALYRENSFITLTYADDKLPQDQGLSKREFQLFMKRLRKALEPKQIRFFGCGEYSKAFRPHYHAIIFNEDFTRDRTIWSKSPKGFYLYRSPFLEECWRLGWVLIGDVSHQSAGYVARYALKKAQSYTQREALDFMDPVTGQIWRREDEFLLMSRNPGIGSTWWDKFASDAFPSDFLVIDGRKMPVPPYYRKKLQAAPTDMPSTLDPAYKIDAKRREAALRRASDNTTERRLVRDEIAHRRSRLLPRD